MADAVEAQRQSRVTSDSAPDAIDCDVNSNFINEEEEEEFDLQHFEIKPRISADAADAECNSARAKRPFVPYSQREIYEKKSTPARRPPVRPTPRRRSTAGSADGSSSPVNPPINSPSYSHVRTSSSASISAASPTTACGTPAAANRTTPTQSAIPSATATPRARTCTAGTCQATPQGLPYSITHQLASTPTLERVRQLSDPNSHHHSSQAPATRTPNNSRPRGLTSPAPMLCNPVTQTSTAAHAPATICTPATAATTLSARLDRTQSAERPVRPQPLLYYAQKSPGRAVSILHAMTAAPPAAQAGKPTPEVASPPAASTSQAKSPSAAYSHSPASPQPGWNSAICKGHTPRSANPFRTPPTATSWKPPKKPQQAVCKSSGRKVQTVETATTSALAPSSGGNDGDAGIQSTLHEKGSTELSRSTKAECVGVRTKQADVMVMAGGSDAGEPLEVESLGLIDLETCESTSLCDGGAAQGQAGGLWMGTCAGGQGSPALDGTDSLEGIVGSGPSVAAGRKSVDGGQWRGAVEGERARAHWRVAGGCGCIII